MNSSAHKANVLGNYNYISVGICVVKYKIRPADEDDWYDESKWATKTYSYATEWFIRK